MNKLNKQTAFSSGFFVALCFAGISAQAQTSINMSSEVFIDTPVLPLAPPPVPVSQIAVAPVIAAVPTSLPLETPGVAILRGKPVDEQLRAIGKKNGWELIWQGPEYVLDHSITLPADFEKSIDYFLKGANEAGSRLRAVFYRGNKTVRISEF